VLVGAGERSRATLIPAIHAAAGLVELAGVATRTARPIELLGARFRATTTTLADLDLSGVDAAIVSVGTRAVPAVVAELAERGGPALTVMVDTPVLEPSDLGARRTFGRLRSVLASEDNFALPLFVAARRLLDEGAIGRLRRAYLFHSGYRHHAIAALRRLTGSRARRVSVDRSSRWSAEVHVAFPHGVRALIVEPRRYEIGRTLLVGESGMIADYDVDHARAVRIDYATRDGRYRGLTVDGEPLPATELDEAFASALDGAPLEDDSLMNQMKIRGFMSLLGGLADPRSPERYPAVEAIEDNLTMHFAERLRVAPGGGVLLRSAGRVAGRFVGRGEEPA
jgi:predicted dehydrogenase